MTVSSHGRVDAVFQGRGRRHRAGRRMTKAMSGPVAVDAVGAIRDGQHHGQRPSRSPKQRSASKQQRGFGPVLILFGDEDAKGKKVCDLRMFELKSLTWLPLNYNCVQQGPHVRPRCRWGPGGEARAVVQDKLDVHLGLGVQRQAAGLVAVPKMGKEETNFWTLWTGLFKGPTSKKSRAYMMGFLVLGVT